MNAKLIKIGRFLRVVDEATPVLSITNICMWVIIAKIAYATDFSIADIGGLFVGLVGYSSKKYFVNKAAAAATNVAAQDLNPQLEKFKNDIQDLKDKVGAASLAAGIRKN